MSAISKAVLTFLFGPRKTLRLEPVKRGKVAVSLLIPLVALGPGALRGDPVTPAQLYDFRVSSELVIVPVTVTDRHGQTALSLQPADFVVAEEGIPQPIVSFSRWDAPASVGLVFDTSGSMKSSVEISNTAVRTLLSENGAEDEAFLITFADSPRLEVDFTRDAERIPETLLWRERRGATALFDAIYCGLDRMRHAQISRKALVVVTDGGDNHSRYSFDELLSTARESDVQIYTVAIRRSARDIDEQRGRLQLDQLAHETGGALLTVESEAQLPEAMSKLNQLIRNQYLLAYRPPEGIRHGKWRKVRVRLQPAALASRYRILSKGGYYANAQ